MGGNDKMMVTQDDDPVAMFTKELRAAERNVEMLANLCEYLSSQVSKFTQYRTQDTLKRIQYLRKYYLDPEDHSQGSRWVYDRPCLWMDAARHEDTLHRIEKEAEAEKALYGNLMPFTYQKVEVKDGSK